MINLIRPTWRSLRSDLSGGLVGALLSIPQSMGMGVVALAPLGPDFAGLGLMAGLLGGVVVTTCSALFGGAPGLISGPRGSVSLVFAAILAGLLSVESLFISGTGREPAVLSLALISLIAAGLLQVAFGVFRFGNAIKYVPYPVIAGFLNAAAILIILGQIRVVFDLPADESIFDFWRYIDRNSLARAGFVIAVVAVTLSLPKWLPRIPGLMVGTLFGLAFYYGVLETGAAVDLGQTIAGMPEITFDPRPIYDLAGLSSAAWISVVSGANEVVFDVLRFDAETTAVVAAILVPGAISIALLQSFDSLFASVVLEDLTQQRSDARRELIAQGFGTVLSGAVGFLGGSGSLARTRLAVLAGGQTAWSSLSSSVFILAVVLLLAPVVQFIPAVLIAAVLFVIAIELFDKWTIGLLKSIVRNGFFAQKAVAVDLSIVALVVGTGLLFGLVQAVGVGVVVATVVFVLSVGRSPIRRFYRGDAVSSFLQRGDFSAALLREHGDRIAVLEIEGPLFFGSAGKIEREVDRQVDEGARHIILDMKRVNSVDSTASQMLSRISRRLEKRDCALMASYLLPELQSAASDASNPEGLRAPTALHDNWLKLRQFGTVDAIGRSHVFPDTDTAMRHCEMLLMDDIAGRDNPQDATLPASAGILEALSADELDVVSAYAEECSFEAGSALFKQGDEGDALYILLDGMVDALVNHDATGRAIRVNTMTKGAVFGEMAILDPKPRSATIVAMEDTTCYRISAAQLERLNTENPAFGFRLMKYMCLLFTNRLRLANLAIIELES